MSKGLRLLCKAIEESVNGRTIKVNIREKTNKQIIQIFVKNTILEILHEDEETVQIKTKNITHIEAFVTPKVCKVKDIAKWERIYLPLGQYGKLILSTSAGIMDSAEARRMHVGGKIIAYFY